MLSGRYIGQLFLIEYLRCKENKEAVSKEMVFLFFSEQKIKY